MRWATKIVRWQVLPISFTVCCMAPMVCAGGFAIADQSASAAAHATVGTAAGLMDASTAFYNPATLTLLDKVIIGVGAKWNVATNGYVIASYNYLLSATPASNKAPRPPAHCAGCIQTEYRALACPSAPASEEERRNPPREGHLSSN